MDDEQKAAVLFGNPGGSPGDHGNIESALNAAFRPLQDGARGERNHDLAREIGSVRDTLGKGMLELGFSAASAAEFAGLLGEYYGAPREREVVEKNLDKALDELSTEWGADFHNRLDGATRILASLTKGNPRLMDFVHGTGLSHDVRFLRLAGEIAKAQPILQAEKRGEAQAAKASRMRPSGSRISNALYGGKKG
jgi:hypothetical protein